MPSDNGLQEGRLTHYPPAPRRPFIIERAFELAREGNDLTAIRNALKAEGYENAAAKLYGPQLLASLKRARLTR